MEGSHSPFGFIWQIASQTGWSIHYILWKVSYPSLLMMMNDAPRFVSADELKKRNRQTVKGNYKQAKGQNALNFFQTKLVEEENIEIQM